jgi:hypothetical protein
MSSRARLALATLKQGYCSCMMTAPGESPLSAQLAKGGLRERHLDLLLAEELAVNPNFARWVVEGAQRDLEDGQREPLALPAGAPSRISTTVSYWDSSGHPGAAGETDVLVRLEWEDGAAVGLFVEDKLDAVFQPWQAERYAARAAAAEIPTATVLVAPRAFIGRSGSSFLFGKALPMEDITDWLQAEATRVDPSLGARLSWRANAVAVLATKRPLAVDHPWAVRFTELFAEAVETQSCVVDRLSCHTANQGWIWFRMPPALGYKAIHGVVDLYVKDIGRDLGYEAITQRLEKRCPAGFSVAQDTVPNTVLRARVPRPLDPVTAFTPEGKIADRETFDAAVGACREAVRWLGSGGSELLRAP